MKDSEKRLAIIASVATVLGLFVACVALIPAFGQWIAPLPSESRLGDTPTIAEASNTPVSPSTPTTAVVREATQNVSTTLANNLVTIEPTSSLQAESPTEQSSAFPTPSRLNANLIPFSDSNDPALLNLAWTWQIGMSIANSYQLIPSVNGLKLIAGPETWPSAPMVIYPVTGDFQAQVSITFETSKEQLSGEGQSVGIGVRAIQEPDPHKWFIVMKHLSSDGRTIHGGVVETNMIFNPYPSNTAIIMIERTGSLFSSSYSPQGGNFIPLNKDLILEMPNNAEIFLFVYSTYNEGLVGQFNDFLITLK